MTTVVPASQTIDIRTLGTCSDRKAHVLAAFDALEAGQSLVVVNDHLPNGLHRHFEQRRPGAFEWALVEAGPEVFRVAISKRA
jgi:uncharacterized protein (DUF2249 family)